MIFVAFQVTQQMSSTLTRFIRSETVAVFVVELPSCTVNAIVGSINPRAANRKETETDILNAIDRLVILLTEQRFVRLAFILFFFCFL